MNVSRAISTAVLLTNLVLSSPIETQATGISECKVDPRWNSTEEFQTNLPEISILNSKIPGQEAVDENMQKIFRFALEFADVIEDSRYNDLDDSGIGFGNPYATGLAIPDGQITVSNIMRSMVRDYESGRYSVKFSPDKNVRAYFIRKDIIRMEDGRLNFVGEINHNNSFFPNQDGLLGQIYTDLDGNDCDDVNVLVGLLIHLHEYTHFLQQETIFQNFMFYSTQQEWFADWIRNLDESKINIAFDRDLIINTYFSGTKDIQDLFNEDKFVFEQLLNIFEKNYNHHWRPSGYMHVEAVANIVMEQARANIANEYGTKLKMFSWNVEEGKGTILDLMPDTQHLSDFFYSQFKDNKGIKGYEIFNPVLPGSLAYGILNDPDSPYRREG